ncbi:unnamed protein product [Rotaria sordida]|uniref:LIM zinc-binding domain-containing protein n=2 Tax=Rotaria sordida TaxID=392033 RepID=A0A814LY62_9BILA|nr:unnamed protein product [Rotaria sordida]CAF1071361.1 unnamed protein product [Rotaria sordida]CAF1254254.1 unnamed protein product [Rotaria sordida]
MLTALSSLIQLKMSYKNQETPHCPRCGHAAFHAESIPAAGKVWHKTCFRCALCKKALEVTTLSEHDGDLYCKQCYTRKFGIRGVGFGIGAGALGMDTGERFGNTQSLSNKPNYPPIPGIIPPS